jgi:uncharacterized protein YvpB/LysM repeat protein
MKRLLEVIILATVLILADVSTATGKKLPDTVYITGVIGHAQGYSLSCEARSAADLAAFWGVYVSETQFLWALPEADNPEQGFVGNPNEPWGNIPPHGYGVYAGPVADALDELGLQAAGLNHLSWDDLRSQVSGGNPVIVWIIGQMWPGTPVHYKAPDGSTTSVAPFEHTMILIGYSPDTVQVIDAYSGQYQMYPLNTFLKSWSVLGNMAVFVSPGDSSQQEATADSGGNVYIVQPGDFLIALARQFGVSWQQLAELNAISYPYTIHPGQALQVPVNAVQESQPAVTPENEQSQPSAGPVTYLARLPIIQQNHAMHPDSAIEPAPTSWNKGLELDEQLLVQLTELLGPHMVNPAQFLK